MLEVGKALRLLREASRRNPTLDILDDLDDELSEIRDLVEEIQLKVDINKSDLEEMSKYGMSGGANNYRRKAGTERRWSDRGNKRST